MTPPRSRFAASFSTTVLCIPLRARYTGLGNFRDNRDVRTRKSAGFVRRRRIVYTKYLTLRTMLIEESRLCFKISVDQPTRRT
jgi:hypothetical protein